MCDPDYCIYTGDVNEPAKPGRSTLRSSGLHIHVGYPNNNIDTSLIMLLYIDAYVGVPSVLYDTDTERKKLYGKAGCFRLQKWGVEYRTLSSYWLANESRITFIWKQLEWALHCFENNIALPESSDVQKAINENNIDLANTLIEKYKLIHPDNIIPE